MTDSVATVVSTTSVAGLANGYVTAYGGALPIAEREEMNAGAGSIISTAHDMAAWQSMQINGEKLPDGTPLLSEKLIRESHTPQAGAGRYGLGCGTGPSRESSPSRWPIPVP